MNAAARLHCMHFHPHPPKEFAPVNYSALGAQNHAELAKLTIAVNLLYTVSSSHRIRPAAGLHAVKAFLRFRVT